MTPPPNQLKVMAAVLSIVNCQLRTNLTTAMSTGAWIIHAKIKLYGTAALAPTQLQLWELSER